MSTEAIHTAEAMQAIAQNLARASKGERDPVDIKRALEELTLRREALRQRIGTVTMAVDLVRDARNP